MILSCGAGRIRTCRDTVRSAPVHRANVRCPGRSAGASLIVYSNTNLASTTNDRLAALCVCSSVTCPRIEMHLRLSRRPSSLLNFGYVAC